MNGNDILTRMRLVVNDQDAVRWTGDELVLWINDGCRFICLLRPDAAAVNSTLTLAVGSKQSVAALTPAGLRVLDVIRNGMGRAMRYVVREILDTQLPTWHSSAQGQPTNWTMDNRDPKTFYVYPPAIVGSTADVLYARNPVALTSTAELTSVQLSLDDIYIDPLLNYVLYRCYAKDADFAHNANLSGAYLAACVGALKGKTGADVGFSPHLTAAGGKPSPAQTTGAGV